MFCGDDGIKWKNKPDDDIDFGNNTSSSSVSIKVNGPFRLEPTSITPGADSASIGVQWSALGKNGKPMTEVRHHYDPKNDSSKFAPREHKMTGGYGAGFGYYDFAPPYEKTNPYGYMVTISKPAQFDSHDNPSGLRVKVYSQDGDQHAKRYNE